jgi:3-deoxy-D-manno-octulosonic acid kinase
MIEVLNREEGNCFWRYDPSCFEPISSAMFESSHWKDKDAIIGQESGRGTTWFIKHNEHELVLRHYLRGGMMRHVSHDRYIFNGLKKTRSIAEFDILNALLKKNLPVPKPAAAQVIKHGLFYEADLLTHKIPYAQDLIQVLRQAQPKEFYRELGGVIAKFHELGVFHADLNIQNILQDKSGKFWLIDFDRAQILPPQAKWQQATLKRLKRSFEKERVRFDIKWSEQDWDGLMQGYKI